MANFILASAENKHCHHHCSTFICLSLFYVTPTILGLAQFPPNCIQYRFGWQLFYMLSDNLFRAFPRLLWILCPDLSATSSPPTSVYLCCQQLTNNPVVCMNFKEENKSCWQGAKVKKDKCCIKWRSISKLECWYLLYASDLWNVTFPLFISQHTNNHGLEIRHKGQLEWVSTLSWLIKGFQRFK